MDQAPNKAIGIDTIGPEIFQADPTFWAEKLVVMFENMPPDTQEGWVAFLFKNKGEKSGTGNYRPVTILDTIYKIWASVQVNRTQRIVEEVVNKFHLLEFV